MTLLRANAPELLKPRKTKSWKGKKSVFRKFGIKTKRGK
jgi:hypothetical protein